MSNATTLARPYAKAAFELAVAENATGRWNDMLDLASAAVTEKSLAGLLESPHASSSQIVQILLDTAGEAFDARFKDFLSVLADNKRLVAVTGNRRFCTRRCVKRPTACFVSGSFRHLHLMKTRPHA